MALTAKQTRFVEEYLVDLNATQAAIRAGYSKKTAGQIGDENLKKPEIAQAIAAAQQKRSQRTEITQDMVLREYAKIAFADIRKVAKWGESVLVRTEDDEGAKEVALKHTVALLASDSLDDDTAAAVEEVSEGKQGLKIKMHDKKGALDSIARHLGMFVDRGVLDVTHRTLAQELADLNDARTADDPEVA
jgi:phage terminase small subunit